MMHYYQYLIDALDLKASDYLLDYGCGSGNLLKYLLDVPARILAVDADIKPLNQAKAKLTDQKVSFKHILSPKKIKNEKFDKIICHNVLECVDNKIDFINQFMPLIKTDGYLVLSHFDFDSALFYSSDKEFTRNLIHAYADATGKWQKFSDGQIGRKIPSMLKASNFKNYQWQVIRLTEEKFSEGYYGYLFAQMLLHFGKSVYGEKLDNWYNNLQALSNKNQHQQLAAEYYFFAIDLFISIIKL